MFFMDLKVMTPINSRRSSMWFTATWGHTELLRRNETSALSSWHWRMMPKTDCSFSQQDLWLFGNWLYLTLKNCHVYVYLTLFIMCQIIQCQCQEQGRFIWQVKNIKYMRLLDTFYASSNPVSRIRGCLFDKVYA